MKKIYILAAIALVAGVSCTKQVPADNNSPDVPISFSPISQRAGTKANVFGEIPTTYDTQESFLAYSYFTAQASTVSGYNPKELAATPDATKGSEFFPVAGVQCDYNNTYDAWEPTTSYYWPKAGYLHFHAISPAAFTKTTLTHSWVNGLSITAYVAPEYDDNATDETLTTDNQIDLLYSNFVYDRQRSGYNPQTGVPYDDAADAASHNGVDIIFNHALSAINFKVKTAGDYLTGTQQHKFIVRKIEILNAYNTGNFTENRATSADQEFNVVADMSNKVGFTPTNADGSKTPYWSYFSNELANITPYDATAGTGITASTTVSDLIGTQIIALPQPLDHGSSANKVKIKVTYDYWFSNNSGSTWIKYEGANALVSELDIAGYYASKYGGADATIGGTTLGYQVNYWLINHKYTYVLNFKLDPIIFDPKVEAFVLVDNIGVDLPFQN